MNTNKSKSSQKKIVSTLDETTGKWIPETKTKKIKLDGKGREIVDAKDELVFVIAAGDVEKAVCKDPNACVIANGAISSFERFCGNLIKLDGIEVGTSIVKLYVPAIGGERAKVIRYGVSGKLRQAILTFDKTGKWILPLGEYRLSVLSQTQKLGGRPNRWARVHTNKSGGGRDMFNSRAAMSRQIKRDKDGGFVVVNSPA